jgi:hypothetical protein
LVFLKFVPYDRSTNGYTGFSIQNFVTIQDCGRPDLVHLASMYLLFVFHIGFTTRTSTMNMTAAIIMAASADLGM